jgi:hypothetical protein
LPALPYFVQWVARRPSAEIQRPGKGMGLADKVESLCRDTHGLMELLEGPDRHDDASLFVRAVEVRNKFHALQRSFREHINRLEEADLPRVWRAIDDALVVPLDDVKLRMLLLSRKSRIGGRFLAEAEADDARGQAPSATENDAQAKEAARVQIRLALALLGPRYFDEWPGDRPETFKQVAQRGETFVVEEQWWNSLTEAGEQIGLRWRHLPEEITALTGGRKAAAPPNPLAAQTADRLCRFADSYGSLRLAHNAVEAYRHLLVQDLLLAQAERTRLDFWAAEDAALPPYYLAAANAYLADVVRLGARHPGLAAARQRLDGMGKLELQGVDARPTEAGPAVQHLTSEDEFPVQYRLAATGGPVPSGFPVVRLEAGPSLEITTPSGGAKEWKDKGPPLGLACLVKSPLTRQAEAEPPLTPAVTRTNLTVHGLYRGRHFTLPIPIDVHPAAENVLTDHALPPRATVAVRGPRTLQEFAGGRGALAVVLDCSRSMGPPAGKEFSSTTKYAQATAALRKVLSKLPKGTTVSIWVFGQAVGAEKTAPTPEDTIQRVQDPVVWDPDDPAQLQTVMSKVEWPALEPWNQSPIIRAMVKAARSDLDGARSAKTLLVITDGMDNRFDKDTTLNPDRKDTRTFFREQFRDIEVDVIGFRVTNIEMTKAKEQFEVVKDLPVPGKFYTVNDGPELAGTLHKVLRQKLRYWIDLRDNAPLRGDGSDLLYLSEDDANDQWLSGGLEPGTYKLRVLTSRRLTRSIALEPGDRMLIELNPDRGQGPGSEAPEFERLLYSQAYFPWKPAAEKKRWRLAVVQNQWVADRGVQLLVTLEEKDDPGANVLQQIKPVKTWVEVVTPKGSAPICQRWHYQAGYPAPAWGVDVPQWPRRPGAGGQGGPPVRPELRVWWSPDQEPYGAYLEHGHDFTTPQEIVAKTVSLKDQDVVIESVRVEPHRVEVRPAEGDRPAVRETRNCLVVRVAHVPGRPVWVRLRGLNLLGEEHRFYDSAGKYTALFWPATGGDAAKLLQSIEVFSLTAFKKRAEERAFVLHLKNLYEPQADDERPRPVELRSGTRELPLPRPVYLPEPASTKR